MLELRVLVLFLQFFFYEMKNGSSLRQLGIGRKREKQEVKKLGQLGIIR